MSGPASVGFRFPTRVSINISRRCNLSCDHCLSSSGVADSNELTTTELCGLVDQLKNAGCPILAIGGGEPLMRRDLFEVISYTRASDIPVSVVTNGTLVNEKIAQRLSELTLVGVTVSIDGLKENHDLVRGQGGFDRAVRGIVILRQWLKTTKLNIRMTVTARNLDDCAQVIFLAGELEVDSIRLTPALPLGRAIQNQHLFLSQDQYFRFIAECREVQSSVKIVLPDEKPDPATFKPGEFGRHCGREVCWITQTGDVYPCIFYGDGYRAGNIRDERFIDLWDKCREMSRFSGNSYCNNCEIYKDCRGGCRCRSLWQYGDINAIDPYCPLGKNKEYEATLPSDRATVHRDERGVSLRLI